MTWPIAMRDSPCLTREPSQHQEPDTALAWREVPSACALIGQRGIMQGASCPVAVRAFAGVPAECDAEVVAAAVQVDARNNRLPGSLVRGLPRNECTKLAGSGYLCLTDQVPEVHDQFGDGHLIYERVVGPDTGDLR